MSQGKIMAGLRKLRESIEQLHDHLTESQWDALRVGVVILGAGALAAGGYYAGAPAWRRWQSRQALDQARVFAQHRDYSNLLLAVRRAVALTPFDRTTWESAAQDFAQIDSAQELVAREVLTRLAPQDVPARLALAQAALHFGRPDRARLALAGVDEGTRRSLAYVRLAVALDLAEGRWPALPGELASLIALDPADANARFTYAAMRLWSESESERVAARAELLGLLAVPDVRIRATIELISEASRRQDSSRVHVLLGRFLSVFAPGAPVDLARSDVDGWNALLGGMMADASVRPADAALLARWLSQQGRRERALAWLQALPAPTGQAAAVADMAAQLAAEAGDYPVLAARLRAGAWGTWPEQAWTLAIASHRAVQRSAGGPTWAMAIAACGDSPEGLRNLGRLATAWNQPADAEAAWLAIFRQDPGVAWAFEALETSYAARHDEKSLFDLYAARVEHVPADEATAARWILLACVLDRASPAVFGRADRLGSDKPENIIARAATLWRRRRVGEAEATLQSLGPADRNTPVAALWIALVESDLGHEPAARAALAEAWSTPHGAAEDELLEQASRSVGYNYVQVR